MARQPDSSPFDETAEPHPDRSTQSALDAERIVESGSEDYGFEPVVLRGRYFYAADAAHTRQFGERLLERNLPIIGGGFLVRCDATLSLLHVDNASRAYVAAIEGESTGCFHVVDDEPVTYTQFLWAFADRLDAPPPRRVPAWLTRFFVGAEIVRLLSHPMPTTNARFREAFDWTPRCPTYHDGLDQVLKTWRETGTVREGAGGYEWANE